MNKMRKINFLSVRKYTLIISCLVTVLSFYAIYKKGINFGMDFKGGTVVTVYFYEKITKEKVRSKLRENDVTGLQIKNHDSKSDNNIFDIYIPDNSIQNTYNIKKEIKKTFECKIKKTEFIGAEVGDELVEKSVIAIFISILFIIAYISLRFEYYFAISSAISLIYVTISIVGVISLLDIQFNFHK